MLPDMVGEPLTGMHRGAPLPQPLLAVTQTFPVVKVPNDALIEVDPCPELIVPGVVHV